MGFDLTLLGIVKTFPLFELGPVTLTLSEGRVGALSKGTRVKLGLVAALAQRCTLLILDEPTAGVDPTAREEFYEIILDLRKYDPKLCILLSSHIFDDLDALADDVMILHRGRIAFQSSREQLQSLSLYRLTPGLEVPESDDICLRWVARGQPWIMARRGTVTATRLGATPGCVEEPSPHILAAAYRAVASLAARDTR